MLWDWHKFNNFFYYICAIFLIYFYTIFLKLDLTKSSRENNEDALLVMFDLVNLYTNIPHTFGLENHTKGLHARFIF